MQRKCDCVSPAIALACILVLFGIGATARTSTFRGAPVTVSIYPVSAILTGGTQQFTATVTGSTNTAVTWSATGGTVSANGLYTAPATAGTYSVTATSQADSTKSASATVTVTAPSSPLAFVQVAAATPQSPQSTVKVIYTAAQTAGNLNVVVVGWNDSTSKVTSVSDSLLNAYTLAVGPTTGTGLSQSIYYAKDIASGSNTVTVTFNQAAANPDIRILEYAGLDTVSPLDVTAAAVGNSNSASSGSATTTAASELILGADTIAITTTGPGSGFTRRIITSPDSDLVEDKVVSTSGSYSATATLSSGSWVMQMAAFKAASSTTPPAVAVSVGPSSASLATGGTQQFSATVTGSSNTAVTWSATGGTVSANGLYTAPATAGTYSVTATSQADSTKSASATVAVTTPPVVAVSISPLSAALLTGGTQQFTAYVSGSSNTAVTWSATGGTVSSSGLYTAPATAGTYSVTATSQANSTKSASATVTVTTPAVGVSISPVSAALLTGATQQFTATVTGSTNTAVTWSATGGTVSSSGLYTAPATAGTYSVTATSQANNTKSASATVTVTALAVGVSISPVSAALLTGATQQFTATVTGSTNTAVTWLATGGTVSTNGLYTAPATAGTYSITATSQADSTKSATASVTVISSSAGSPTLVQHVSSSNTRGNDFSSPYCYHYQLPNFTTAGNSVVVGFTFNGKPTPTVSDDQGNSYSIQVNYYDSAHTQSIAIATAFNIVAGARVISVCFSSDPGGYVQPMATEFNNVVGIDAAVASQGSGTSATAGSMTPTVVGDLAYQVVFNMPPKQSAFTAGSQSNISWSLLSADLMDGWAAQYGLYNSTSAINPTLTMGTSQNWVSAAVLLKTGTSGSVPSGMRIVHLMHENIPVNTAAGGTGNSFANPILLQFPSSGNLLVAMIGGGLACTVTNITDTNQNAWTQAGATQTIGGNDTVQAYYAENAVSGNLGLTVQWSATDGDQTIFFYDVTGAATSPLDTTAGSSGSQSVAGNLTMPFTITPAGANEIIFEEVIWDSNTASGLVGPEQFFDSNTFDGESQSGPEPVDQNNGWGHALTTSTAPVAITWETMYSGLATGNWAGMAAAFTAAP